jgi:hypothetical protein
MSFRRNALAMNGNAMKKNVGGIDKAIRIIIGLALALVGVFVQMSTGLRMVAFVAAAIAVLTAFTGF